MRGRRYQYEDKREKGDVPTPAGLDKLIHNFAKVNESHELTSGDGSGIT
jgi:hypothetical protein